MLTTYSRPTPTPGDRYQVLKKLGQGGFAPVYLAQRVEGLGNLFLKANYWPSGTSAMVAIKDLQYDPKDEKKRTNAWAEVNMLKKCQSPYIVRFIDSFIASQSPTQIREALVIEFCPYGDLFSFVGESIKAQEEIPEECIWQVVACIISALEYIHGVKPLGIAHRDVKSENILIDSNGIPKLCDFGLSAKFNNEGKLTTCVGTRHYAAPEVLRGEAYGGKVDVWSLGIVVTEMAKRETPHFSLPTDPAPALSTENNKWSNELVDYVELSCKKNAEERPDSSFMSRRHPFVTGKGESPLESKHLLHFMELLDAKIRAMNRPVEHNVNHVAANHETFQGRNGSMVYSSVSSSTSLSPVLPACRSTSISSDDSVFPLLHYDSSQDGVPPPPPPPLLLPPRKEQSDNEDCCACS